MSIMIRVFFHLLFVADIILAMEVEVTLLKIGVTETIPCGHMDNDTEFRIVQWYKIRSIDDIRNEDDILAWWTESESGGLPNYHMENTLFSLVIDTTTLEHESLYLCSVRRGDLFFESKYYARTVMYALPRMDPNITLDIVLNRVCCTVEHVKPLIYPVLNFDLIPDSTETYAVMHEDGTYTTSISCALPQNKSVSRVDCSFFFLHYQRVGSLDLRDTTTDSLLENITLTASPTGPSGIFAGHTCIGAEVSLGVLLLTNIILLIRWSIKIKYHRVGRDCNEEEESESDDMRLPK